MGLLEVYSKPASSLITALGRTAPVAIRTNFWEQGNFQIWIEPSNGFRAVFANLKRELLQNVSLAFHERESDIELKLMEEQKLSMKIFTVPHLMPAQTAFDWTRDDIDQDPESLINILVRAAIFYGELRRAQHNTRISDSISIEFYELDRDVVPIFSKEMEDSIPELLAPTEAHENLWKDGDVTIHVPDNQADIKTQKPYGIKLTNHSNVDLFVNILSFVNHDSSIPRPEHPIISGSNKRYIPLQRKREVVNNLMGKELVPGTLTIGYGDGGYAPLSFGIDNKPLTTEVDFLKIYLTTESAELSTFALSRMYHSRVKAMEGVSVHLLESYNHTCCTTPL